MAVLDALAINVMRPKPKQLKAKVAATSDEARLMLQMSQEKLAEGLW